jgi:hypothetical protein
VTDWDEATPDARTIARSLTAISHGGVDGPQGLESVAMALCSGDPTRGRNVTDGLLAIASSIDNLAEAIRGRSAVG